MARKISRIQTSNGSVPLTGAESPDKYVIRTVFDEVFGPGLLLDLHVVPDSGSDGGPVLRISAILDEPEKLDPGKVLHFLRLLRLRLEGAAFPVPSFISSADAATLSFEPA